MRIKRFLSGFLAITLALSCINWRAASAQNVQTSNTTNSTYATEISDTNLDALTENSQILDHVDSEQFFDAEHIARLPEEETLDSYVFLNRDGSKSIYYMEQPVKYVDSNGVIQEKDTTLIRSNGGYCMRNNDIDLHIPDAVATGITVAYNNQTVKLTPQGGSGSAQQYDNSIVYYDYYGIGTILRYTPMLSGVKEDIILAKYTGQNSFTFLLETNGLQLYEDQGQYYLAENQDISAAFYLGQIAVYDAIGRPDLGTMTAETIIPGQKYRLTIAANESFLLDPETVYPVTIDPTVTVRDSADVSGTVEDAPVFSGYANRSFGDYVFNNIGYVDGYKLARTAFRLTSLLADSNYNQLSAEQLNSVSFHLKGSGGQFANLSLHALTENATWTESTLTWNNLGAYSETAYTTVRMGSSVWKTFDITALAKDWKTGAQNPDCGFVLISDSTTSSVSTFSAEYSTVDYRPYVVVNYTGTIALNQVSATLSVGGTLALTATTTPTGQVVSWASEDPTVAEVSEDGVVTALSLGTTTITASLEDGTSAECEVTVVAKSISLNYNTSDKIASVYKGETITLIATTEPPGEDVEWISLNPDVATVSDNGVVTAVSAGETTIRAYIDDETYAECTVIVKNRTIALNTLILELCVGERYLLKAETNPYTALIYWTSLNPSIASVSSSGEVTGVSPGQTIVTARTADGRAMFCSVKVVEQQISILGESSVREGESITLSVTKRPTDWNVVWTSSDPSIATVSQTGEVTGVKAGTVTITATMEDGPCATHTVYVAIPDGVYYICNKQSGYYLQTEQRRILSFTNLVQSGLLQSTDATSARIAQMWRITYLSDGMYSIRPLSKLDMCLYAERGTSISAEPVVIYPHESDVYEDIPTRCQWTISASTNGYVIRYRGVESYSLKPTSTTGILNDRIIVGSYSSTMLGCHWDLVAVTNVPSGLVLYDMQTGLPANTSTPKYVAPGQTRSLSSMGLEIATFPYNHWKNHVYYRVNNSQLASIDNSGSITGIMGGDTSIRIWLTSTGDINSSGIEFSLTITPIPEGTYFLRNKASGYYAETDSAIMENDRTICQMEFYGGDTQKWVFTHLGDGTYSIHSANSTTKYYLGVKYDSSSIGQDIVLRTGTITSGMKWIITTTSSGAFRLMPVSGKSNGCVLATSTSSPINFAKLVQYDYHNDNNHRDEWLLEPSFIAIIENYYDHGYHIRFFENEDTSKKKIDEYCRIVSEMYWHLFNLKLIIVYPQYYSSPIDVCKKTVNISNIDTLCNHEDKVNHTDRQAVLNDFLSFYPQSDISTGVLWTCHKIQSVADNGDVDDNRSCSCCSIVLMLSTNSSSRSKYSTGILMHELNHQYGAKDHYHELLDKNDPKSCKHKDICSTCGENRRPESCIMNNSHTDIHRDDIICDACKNDILAHLYEHHFENKEN